MTKFTTKFKLLFQIISIITIGFYSGQTALAKKDKKFSATEKKQIEKMIHDYILKHPEIIPEAIELFKKNSQRIKKNIQILIHGVTAQLILDSHKMADIYKPRYHGYSRIGFAALNHMNVLVKVKFIEVTKVKIDYGL